MILLRNSRSIQIFILLFALSFLAYFFLSQLFVQPKKAAAEIFRPVKDWAWSENIGWVSFRSIGSVDYGVEIASSTGQFSGYAWSENIGWISFQASDGANVYLEDPLKLGKEDVRVLGTAKVLAWGGDLRFDLPSYPEDSVKIDPQGDFHGWAYEDKAIGWLSFNHSDLKAGSGNYYKVNVFINKPPVAIAKPDNYLIKQFTPVESVDLFGSESYDPDNLPSPLTYSWQITEAPPGSHAYLSNPNLADPQLLNLDQYGLYQLTLTVDDGFESRTDMATIYLWVCGNNIRELTEECDGTDTEACGTADCIEPGFPNECTCAGLTPKQMRWWEIVPQVE